ncbi:MAG: hypothetical protein KKB90_02665 [Actinobacteria bacterium]|nr:hypothetical protein [Actinomycetota bacterium]MCG2819005.1 hypothetical protein [Actinomycetes bacterium]MBU4217846.1 hypothetical protein [Actinomycetota bacterium]MBU4359316.1 hypothetical protein [Actinomycetota bacterium]MBU4392418.1 hypothetical protein [Actinomycetota bacterium]
MVDGKVGERPIEWIMEGMKGAQYLCDEGIACPLLLTSWGAIVNIHRNHDSGTKPLRSM